MVSAEIRKLHANGNAVQACLPTKMVQKAKLGGGQQVMVIQKQKGTDVTLKDGDIIIRAVDLVIA